MSVALTAQAVADSVGGRLSGEGDRPLRRLRSLERAEAGDLAVCLDARFAPALVTTSAGAVLLPEALAELPGPATRIVVPDPVQALDVVVRLLHPAPATPAGIDPSARLGEGSRLGSEGNVGPHVVIGRSVIIGARARIGPHVVIEDGVVIGDDVRLDAHVVLHQGAVLGDRVWCKAGAVIAGAGFGFFSDRHGHRRSPQVGGCLLGDDVEVGSGSCIDRGSLDDTVVGRGTKIDNLVHVGHNVRIGEACLVVAGAGISGSTIIGDGVILGGQAGLSGHLRIGDGARIAAQAGVIADVEPGVSVSGFPARPHREFLRATAALYRLTPHVTALERMARGEEQDDGTT